MMRINYQLNVQIPNGPRMSLSGRVEAEAYDVIDLSLPVRTDAGTAEDLEVQLQPGTSDGQVKLMVITASRYEDLSYKVNDAAADAVALNGPLLLAGSGAVSLIDSAPASLFFDNAGDAPASIQILIARDPTP